MTDEDERWISFEDALHQTMRVMGWSEERAKMEICLAIAKGELKPFPMRTTETLQ